jgi:hypothetical protein
MALLYISISALNAKFRPTMFLSIVRDRSPKVVNQNNATLRKRMKKQIILHTSRTRISKQLGVRTFSKVVGIALRCNLILTTIQACIDL